MLTITEDGEGDRPPRAPWPPRMSPAGYCSSDSDRKSVSVKCATRHSRAIAWQRPQAP